MNPTDPCLRPGRATCDSCRVHKRKKSATKLSEQRETLTSLQLKNHLLKHQVDQTESKLTASQSEVARLTQLLRKHAADALNIHAAAAAAAANISSAPSSSTSFPPRSMLRGPPGANTDFLNVCLTCLLRADYTHGVLYSIPQPSIHVEHPLGTDGPPRAAREVCSPAQIQIQQQHLQTAKQFEATLNQLQAASAKSLKRKTPDESIVSPPGADWHDFFDGQVAAFDQ